VSRVTVLVLAPDPPSDAGPLERTLFAARRELADRQHGRFLAANADEVVLAGGPADDTPFGARLRAFVLDRRPAGIVVLGGGSVPLATSADLRTFVQAAASPTRGALANNRYSADIVAVSCASEVLRDVPDLPADNALPRWLDENALIPVADLRGRRRLAVDVDSPLDLVLLEGAARERRDASRGDWPVLDAGSAAVVRERIGAIRGVTRDPSAELLVAGRVSAAEVRWLERGTAARSRVLIEERGLRAASHLALAPGRVIDRRREPSSVLGGLLDRDGPERFGDLVATLADAALIDRRVLLAHRLGADERRWPAPEDRFASDLLLAESIRDPWLAALTRSARDAPIPVVFGGHTLVGPGLALALAER
jgi:hypothetical protein